MPLDSSYLQVSDGLGDAALMTIDAPRSISSTTISVSTIVNVPNKFIATSGTLLPSGFMDPATLTNFYGQLSGSDLQIDGFLPGSEDVGNTEGQVVVIKPNTFWANFIATCLNNIMSPDGSALKTDIPLDTPTITDFENAQHDHSDAENGGALGAGVVLNSMMADEDLEPNGGWVDYSASMGLDGWSGTPTKSFFALRIGRIMFFELSVSGTSNSNAARITLPADIRPDTSRTQTWYDARAVDNGGTAAPTRGYWSAGEPRFNFSKDLQGNLFTSSGTKTVQLRGWYLLPAPA